MKYRCHNLHPWINTYVATIPVNIINTGFVKSFLKLFFELSSSGYFIYKYNAQRLPKKITSPITSSFIVLSMLVFLYEFQVLYY